MQKSRRSRLGGLPDAWRWGWPQAWPDASAVEAQRAEFRTFGDPCPRITSKSLSAAFSTIIDALPLAMTEYREISGPQLKAIRRQAGLSQTAMGKLVGCTRDAVSYHERKRRPFRLKEYHWGCLARILTVLGVQILRNYPPNTRARGDGVLLYGDWQQEWLNRQFARINARIVEKASRYPSAAARNPSARAGWR